MTRRGFTLVELLVVVAIIALLVTIVMPALGGAMRMGRRVGCAANLHSLGIAVFIHEGDFGGRLPTHYAGELATFDTFRMRLDEGMAYADPRDYSREPREIIAVGGERVNLGRLLPYVNVTSPETFFCPSQSQRRSSAISYSPSSPPGKPVPPNLWEMREGETTAMATRSSYAARARYGTAETPAPPWTITRYSEHVLYSDFTGVDEWDEWTGRMDVRVPHAGVGYNRLYASGKVKWVKAGPINELRPVGPTEPTQAEMDAYWELLDALP